MKWIVIVYLVSMSCTHALEEMMSSSLALDEISIDIPAGVDAYEEENISHKRRRKILTVLKTVDRDAYICVYVSKEKAGQQFDDRVLEELKTLKNTSSVEIKTTASLPGKLFPIREIIYQDGKDYLNVMYCFSVKGKFYTIYGIGDLNNFIANMDLFRSVLKSVRVPLP